MFNDFMGSFILLQSLFSALFFTCIQLNVEPDELLLKDCNENW